MDPRDDDSRAERVRAIKSDGAFRTISEVAAELNVPQHVLRFWETKFSQVRPLKRGGGRRYYRPEDVILLKRIRGLLYGDGMTIRGVQKLLRETGPKVEADVQEKTATTLSHPTRDEAQRLLAELTALRDDLNAALRVG